MTCGTEWGYKIHRSVGESACRSCLDAVNASSRRRRRLRGVKENRPAQHGSVTKYTSGGCRCDDCRAAQTAYMREYRAGMRLSKQSKWSNPDRIVDLLDIDGGWLTVAGIADRLNISISAASRALYRLRNAGLVESRYVELARAKPGKASMDGRSEWRTL